MALAQITKATIQVLAQHRGEPAVSICFPTRRNNGEAYEGPVRLKNALSQAERVLRERGYPARDLPAELSQGRALVEDSAFWRNRSAGLAVFLSHGQFHEYRVPIPCEELLVIGAFFHLTPLIPAVEGTGFFILAVSKKDVRVYHATQFGIDELDLPGAPESLEALFFDRDLNQHLQLHTVGHGEGAGPVHAAKFHGQTAEDEPWRQRTLHYLRAIDAAVKKVTGTSGAPLVFAGDVSLWPMYREVSTCETLMPDFVRGSPRPLAAADLLDRAWPIVRGRLDEQRKRIIETMQVALARGKATTEIEAIVRGSARNQVEFLLVAAGAHAWGRVDPKAGDILQRDAGPGQADQGEDLLNVAACQTLAAGGRVYVVEPAEMPGNASVAALTRF